MAFLICNLYLKNHTFKTSIFLRACGPGCMHVLKETGRGQASGPLELDLQMIVSHHGGAENGTWRTCKGNSALTPEAFLQPCVLIADSALLSYPGLDDSRWLRVYRL